MAKVNKSKLEVQNQLGTLKKNNKKKNVKKVTNNNSKVVKKGSKQINLVKDAPKKNVKQVQVRVIKDKSKKTASIEKKKTTKSGSREVSVTKKKKRSNQVVKKGSKKVVVSKKKTAVKKVVEPVDIEKSIDNAVPLEEHKEEKVVPVEEKVVVKETKKELHKVIEREEKEPVKVNVVRKESILLYFIAIVLVGILIGMSPFLFYEKKVEEEEAQGFNCTYSEWKQQRSIYCMYNEKGEYYVGELAKYEYDPNTDMCVRYTRYRICE